MQKEDLILLFEILILVFEILTFNLVLINMCIKCDLKTKLCKKIINCINEDY